MPGRPPLVPEVAPKFLLLYDGECVLCNHSVNFILRHDRHDRFRFSPLQSEFGKRILQRSGIDSSKTDSIVLISPDRIFLKSAAVVRIFFQLNFLRKLLGALLWLIPFFIRDAMYDFLARRRYGWFGKSESCIMPSKEILAKFIF